MESKERSGRNQGNLGSFGVWLLFFSGLGAVILYFTSIVICLFSSSFFCLPGFCNVTASTFIFIYSELQHYYNNKRKGI